MVPDSLHAHGELAVITAAESCFNCTLRIKVVKVSGTYILSRD